MNTFTQLWIHDSLRAETQRALRRNSLLNGAIHHAFHYQTPKQSQLWMEVHKRHAPLFSNPEFTDIFTRISIETAAELPPKKIHVISLGPGAGSKEATLLQTLKNQGRSLRYTPIDTSIDLALLSAELAGPLVGKEIHPIAGDLSLLQELPSWLGQFPQDETRVVTAYGLTPNFLPSELFATLRPLLRKNDKLLLSANLTPFPPEQKPPADLPESAYADGCRRVLPQYDNSETLAWITQILGDWQISHLLTPPRFSIEKVDSVNGLSASCQWLGDTQLQWEGETLSFRKDQNLRLFFSLRYTPQLLRQTLLEHGLQPNTGFLTDCGQEGVWSVSPSLREEQPQAIHTTLERLFR